MAVNDVLVAARNIIRVAPVIRLAWMQHDLDLKKTARPFTHEKRLSDGSIAAETAKIMPDAWMDFRMKLVDTEKERRRHIILELDRGTEFDQAEFRKKI